MCCNFDASQCRDCSIAHATLTLGMGGAGAVAAMMTLTAVTVSSAAIIIGFFAAPAAIVGIGMATLLGTSKPVRDFAEEHPGGCYALQTTAFVILSAAAIGGAFYFGLLSFPVLVTLAA